jgi:hypothetical protein
MKKGYVHVTRLLSTLVSREAAYLTDKMLPIETGPLTGSPRLHLLLSLARLDRENFSWFAQRHQFSQLIREDTSPVIPVPTSVQPRREQSRIQISIC